MSEDNTPPFKVGEYVAFYFEPDDWRIGPVKQCYISPYRDSFGEFHKIWMVTMGRINSRADFFYHVCENCRQPFLRHASNGKCLFSPTYWQEIT